MLALNLHYFTKQNLLATAIAFAACTTATTPAFAATGADPVVLTFSTVGDSRQDAEKPDSSVKISGATGSCPLPKGSSGVTANPGLTGQDCLWLQNTKAFARILRTIQSQKANLLFFNGDMIAGYGKASVPVTRTADGTGETAIANPTLNQIVTSDLMQYDQQYSFWRGMVANLMETGTYVVPVPGNHETECKRCVITVTPAVPATATTPAIAAVTRAKPALVENENAWKYYMSDLILDQARLNTILSSTGLSLKNTQNNNTFNLNNNPYNYAGSSVNQDGVTTTNADGLVTDQSKLSYSFDIGASHFVVINTDPVGNDSRAPSKWLDADLTTAVHNGAKNLFVFGHKPAYFYSYAGAAAGSALVDLSPTDGSYFWSVINSHKATYFAGHEHVYNVSQPTGSNGAYQVLVGSGGSPFEDSGKTGILPTDRDYAWATVSIRQSGAVSMTTYGFDASMANPVVTLGTYTLPTAQ